jgi:hypothetical protein
LEKKRLKEKFFDVRPLLEIPVARKRGLGAM